MRRPFLFILGLLVVLGAYVVWSLASTVSGTGPMIWMELKLSAGGKPISPTAVKAVEYCFSENPASNAVTALKGELRTARVEGDSFILTGPFSITRNGLSLPVTAPLYRSLFVRVTLADQRSFIVSFPAISNTKMSGPIYIDLPQ